jgi:hypothetical protein
MLCVLYSLRIYVPTMYLPLLQYVTPIRLTCGGLPWHLLYRYSYYATGILLSIFYHTTYVLKHLLLSTCVAIYVLCLSSYL